MTEIPCTHDKRNITFPGGYAILTGNGNWTAYFHARPHEVVGVTACPGCGTALWYPPEDAAPDVGTFAYSSHYARANGLPYPPRSAA